MKLSRSLLYLLHYARSLHRQPLKIINWPGIERERETDGRQLFYYASRETSAACYCLRFPDFF